MKRNMLTLLLLFAVMSLCAQNPKYVFLFIGDGMATPQRMVAEEFARIIGHGPLTINRFPYHATTRTSSANALITDSAAAATAIACGEKTKNGRIGMDATGKRNLQSVAEVAKSKGKKVGIITSVTINHATPAGFYAHRKDRSQYYAIGLDLIASGFDYFGGGGVSKHNDKKSPDYKGDIYELAAKAGYKVVNTKKDLLNLKPGCGKVLARGSSGSLPYEIDADSSLPTLAEFTAKGIELLDNPAGFFMMIEGGAIDWCGHSNEAAGNLREVIGLDNAVRVAVEFAEKHPGETLIVVTGDHETGGMAMGFAGTGYGLYLSRLAHQKCSIGKFGQIFNNAKKAKGDFSFEDAKKLLTEYFGFQFTGKGDMVLKSAHIKRLEDAFKANRLPQTAKQIMNEFSGVGWTTGAHTALPVLTTSTGVKAELFTGMIENTDISNKLKTLF
ncbi:MAG: alkaline phosphatase [Lentisphaeria bacterium]|nr:alkaline phosphatase [Lentisphaeria bacterium]